MRRIFSLECIYEVCLHFLTKFGSKKVRYAHLIVLDIKTNKFQIIFQVFVLCFYQTEQYPFIDMKHT